MTLRFAHCPQHIGQQTTANGVGIRSLNPFSAGLTEMDHGPTTSIPKMKKALGVRYRVHSVDKGQHSQENCLVTRRRPLWVVASTQVVQVSKDLGPGIANDRWMIVQKRRRNGGNRRKVAHIATHWNAAIQDRNSGIRFDHRRAIAMDAAGRILESTIRSLKDEGYQVVVTGDFNYRVKGGSDNWKYAPENIFHRQNMRVVRDGLDYLAYTKGLKAENTRVIKAGHGPNHSDHPWIVADLRWVA